MSLTLYVFPPSPRSFKVLALTGYLGIDRVLQVIDLTSDEQREASYTAINPNQRVPALDDDGFKLWEANAMLQYLALKRPDSGLLPADPQQRAHVLQWQCWDLAHWEPSCTPLIYERCVKALFNQGEPDMQVVDAALAQFAKVARVLDAHLAARRFVAGDALTVADFSLGAVLNVSDIAGIPIHAYANIQRWHTRLTQIPAWRDAMVSPPCNAVEQTPAQSFA